MLSITVFTYIYTPPTNTGGTHKRGAVGPRGLFPFAYTHGCIHSVFFTYPQWNSIEVGSLKT